MLVSALPRFGALQLVRASDKTLRNIYDNTNHSMAWFALDNDPKKTLHALVTGTNDVDTFDTVLLPTENLPPDEAQTSIKQLTMEFVEKHFGIPSGQSWGPWISRHAFKIKSVSDKDKIDFTDNHLKSE